MRNLIELLAAVHPKKPKCLTKAILLARWMETNKWGYVFKLGWRKSGVAHAWIEIGGRPIDFDGPWREDCQELRKVPINRSLS